MMDCGWMIVVNGFLTGVLIVILFTLLFRNH